MNTSDYLRGVPGLPAATAELLGRLREPLPHQRQAIDAQIESAKARIRCAREHANRSLPQVIEPEPPLTP